MKDTQEPELVAGDRVRPTQSFEGEPPGAVWNILEEDGVHFIIIREGMKEGARRVPKRCVTPVPKPRGAGV